MGAPHDLTVGSSDGPSGVRGGAFKLPSLGSVPTGVGSVGVLILAVALWWLASKRVFVIPDPGATALRLMDDLSVPAYRDNVYVTAQAVGAAWAIAIVAGLVLGLVLGLNASIREASQPILIALNGVPKIVLYPTLILAFGMGSPSKIVMGALFGTFPLVLILSGALRDLPPIYGLLGRSLQVSRAQMVAKIYLPATLAPVLTGIRLAFSLSAVGVVLAELLASRAGIGRMIDQSYQMGQFEQMGATVLLLLIASVSVALVLYTLERRASS